MSSRSCLIPPFLLTPPPSANRQYTAVPRPYLAAADNVIPPAGDVLGMLSSLMRHPRRRTVSIGPQSEADAYEAIALRARARRLSRDGTAFDAAGNMPPSPPSPSPPARLRLVSRAAGGGNADAAVDIADINDETEAGTATQEEAEEEDAASAAKDASHLLAHVHRPRVRYDVEVVAKLAVYAGIGWLSTAGVPVLFELAGLGMGVRPAGRA